ncbi:MAG: four helix bundle protein [Acidobacteria bacterium]|nr:four helix bundle protein [Acidobacteriota bacterium]
MAFFFKDLVVWQEAKALAGEVYDLSDKFPRREIFGITAQIRRAAVSVPSNIAEGQGRLTKGEFLHFLGNARGSLTELVTQLEICADRQYISVAELRQVEIRAFNVLRLLNGLMESLQGKAAVKRRGAAAS